MTHDQSQSRHAPLERRMWSMRSMARSLGCSALAVVAVHLAGAGAGAQEPGHEIRPETQPAVVFTNSSTDTLVVEVQPSVDGACTNEHMAKVDRAIPPGGSWRLVTSKPLCWRRESSARGAGAPGRAWSLVEPAIGEGQRISVN